MCVHFKYLKVNSSEWFTTCSNSIKSTSASRAQFETHSALCVCLYYIKSNNVNESTRTKLKRKRQHIFECKTKIFK